MDPVIVVGIVGVCAVVAIGIVGYLFIMPAERGAGAQQELDRQKAKAEGLQVGAESTQRFIEQQTQHIDEQLQRAKQRDAVDVANELLKRKS